ncbi:MAG: hypothetical protein M1827_004826 [Pycnora praestabilis]|nr:MAG: hypothetical protein M1827_004826 [Pycnora praestabilis]
MFHSEAYTFCRQNNLDPLHGFILTPQPTIQKVNGKRSSALRSNSLPSKELSRRSQAGAGRSQSSSLPKRVWIVIRLRSSRALKRCRGELESFLVLCRDPTNVKRPFEHLPDDDDVEMVRLIDPVCTQTSTTLKTQDFAVSTVRKRAQRTASVSSSAGINTHTLRPVPSSRRTDDGTSLRSAYRRGSEPFSINTSIREDWEDEKEEENPHSFLFPSASGRRSSYA